MRLSYALILLMISYAVAGQVTLPDFQSNATQIDTLDKQQLLNLTSQYDFSISLISHSPYYNITFYQVLGYKEGRWSQFIFYPIVYKNGELKKGRTKIVKEKSNQHLCDSVFTKLVENKLFSMSRDSLNIYDKRVSDAVPELKILHGGNYYDFVIRTKNKLRVVGSHEPDQYHRGISEIEERKYFLACRDSFYRLWKFPNLK
ncbi:MAG TPA: hypothetical protein VE978_16895 [Chitinophagales bacterium]|nr:hypothetical protein [Chitinophagales bacterium]